MGYNIQDVSIGDGLVQDKPKSSLEIILRRARPYIEYLRQDVQSVKVGDFKVRPGKGKRNIVILECKAYFSSGHKIDVHVDVMSRGHWNIGKTHVCINLGDFPIVSDPHDKLVELTKLAWSIDRECVLQQALYDIMKRDIDIAQSNVIDGIMLYMEKHLKKIQDEASNINMDYLRKNFFRVMKPFTGVPADIIKDLLDEFFCKNVQDS